MEKTIESGIEFDRSYWPKCGTEIPSALPIDLNDLWEKYEDQVQTFIAEALISDPPHIHLHRGEHIVVYLWSVGGDTLVINQPLDEMIMEYASDYSAIFSQEQADEVMAQIDALEKIEAVIKVTKDRMNNLLTGWTPDETIIR
jgi:hypothetical protein